MASWPSAEANALFAQGLQNHKHSGDHGADPVNN
jgi:hypothetical protein